MKPEDGFSLLELLVVMLIISVALGVFFGYNYSQRETVLLRSAAGETREFLRMAQGFALLDGRDNECVYLPQSRRLRENLRNREFTLPETVKVFLDGLEPLNDEHLRVTVFYADGSALGGTLKLTAADMELTISIDPVLGDTYLEAGGG